MKKFAIVLIFGLVSILSAQTIQEVSPMIPQHFKFEVTWNVTPSASNMDGLVALSAGTATTWGELSAIVRCNTDGLFDARNGGTYTADASLAYEGGKTYAVRLVGNVFAQKYSVFITPPDADQVTLATDYDFRVPADILLYKCIFINDDAVPGASLLVEDFSFADPTSQMASPLGTEEIRNDAPGDNDDAWLDLGLFDTCPNVHEYTAYHANIVIDGDAGDADWANIPWTPLDVYQNLRDGLDRSYMPWEYFDEYWEGWQDYSAWFKMLWNEDESVLYFLIKEYDDTIMWAGDAFTDVFDPDITNIKQWEGDTYEIEVVPMSPAPPANSLNHICSIFPVENEIRFQELSLVNMPLQLADGNSETSWDETTGKAVFYNRDEATGMNMYEFALKLLPGMVADSVWYFGIGRDEADDEWEDGKNRDAFFLWGAGKRAANQWGTLKFSPDSAPMVGVERHPATVQPQEFQLGANYPNPFNPGTTIPFQLNKTEHVTIAVFNTIGQKIATLVDGPRAAGEYQVYWNATDDHGARMSSGLYFIKMTTEQSTFVHKALLVQ